MNAVFSDILYILDGDEVVNQYEKVIYLNGVYTLTLKVYQNLEYDILYICSRKLTKTCFRYYSGGNIPLQKYT